MYAKLNLPKSALAQSFVNYKVLDLVMLVFGILLCGRLLW